MHRADLRGSCFDLFAAFSFGLPKVQASSNRWQKKLDERSQATLTQQMLHRGLRQKCKAESPRAPGQELNSSLAAVQSSGWLACRRIQNLPGPLPEEIRKDGQQGCGHVMCWNAIEQRYDDSMDIRARCGVFGKHSGGLADPREAEHQGRFILTDSREGCFRENIFNSLPAARLKACSIIL